MDKAGITRAELRVIGVCQKVLLPIAAVQVVAWAGYGVAIATRWARDNGEGAVLMALLTAGAGALGIPPTAGAVYRLSRPLAALSVLAIVPGVGLVVMLAAVGGANRVLRGHGIPVGFL